MAFCASTTPALSQSFDCKKASRPIEHAICNDKAVADMDAELAAKYQAALATHSTNRVELISSERRWTSLRDAQCLPYINNIAKLDDCLRAAYGGRLRAIEKRKFSDIRPISAPISCVTNILGLCSSATHPGSPQRLSAQGVQRLAVAAAKDAHFKGNKFSPFPAKFDSVTRVWTVNFRSTSPSSPDTFNVFVYDATSHTEVTCLGMSWGGAPLAMTEIPEEVRPFVPPGESAIDVLCANLNGTGRPGYLLVTRKEDWDTGSTLQVLLRQPDGKLSSVVRNANVLQPGDQAFIGRSEVIARTNRIKVVHSLLGSGGGDVWTIYFQWSPPDATWLLSRVDKQLVGPGHAEDDIAYVQRPSDFGRITLARFNLDRFEY
jgi:uncharacterized protein YecT (DUF1311 family)